MLRERNYLGQEKVYKWSGEITSRKSTMHSRRSATEIYQAAHHANGLISCLLKQTANHALDRVDFYWNAIQISKKPLRSCHLTGMYQTQGCLERPTPALGVYSSPGLIQGPNTDRFHLVPVAWPCYYHGPNCPTAPADGAAQMATQMGSIRQI